MIKKILLTIIICSGISISANLFWFYSGSSFSPSYFAPPVHLPDALSTTTLPAQTFTFLGHGRQSMVFENKQENLVLKLFYWKRPLRKTWYRHAENWLRFASPTWIFKAIKKRSELHHLFVRYVWALEELPKETGMLAVHFSKTQEPIPITLIDREGNTHDLDGKDIPFVLQKKAELVPSYLNKKLDADDLEGAQKAIHQLQTLLKHRLEKGFIDQRQVYKNNYGFIDGEPVQIDIGKIEKPPSLDLEKEEQKINNSLRKYLCKHYPAVKI